MGAVGAAAHTLAGIGHAHGRNAEPRNGLGGEAGAAEEGEFFVRRQPVEQVVHAVLDGRPEVLVRECFLRVRSADGESERKDGQYAGLGQRCVHRDFPFGLLFMS